MIAKCSHCGGMMRIDESGLPKGRSVRVRCPLCNEVGPIREVSSPAPADRPLGGVEAPQSTSGSPDRPHEQILARPQTTSQETEELSASSGVTSEFRFPAEQGPVAPSEPTFSRTRKMLFWVLGSLLVVAAFALLVNIILPGPYGGKSGTGPPPGKENSTRPAENPRPSQLEKDTGGSPSRR
jgi:predicted Zn finger-like uncharacterized protein